MATVYIKAGRRTLQASRSVGGCGTLRKLLEELDAGRFRCLARLAVAALPAPGLFGCRAAKAAKAEEQTGIPPTRPGQGRGQKDQRDQGSSADHGSLGSRKPRTWSRSAPKPVQEGCRQGRGRRRSRRCSRTQARLRGGQIAPTNRLIPGVRHRAVADPVELDAGRDRAGSRPATPFRGLIAAPEAGRGIQRPQMSAVMCQRTRAVRRTRFSQIVYRAQTDKSQFRAHSPRIARRC